MDRIVGAVIRFQGIVQGVGFRPLVYRRAISLNLKGIIRNTDRGVFIQIDGTENTIRKFYEGILHEPPVLAEIHESSIDFVHMHGYDDFIITGSDEDGGGFTPVSPDIGTCSACLHEIMDPSDRRHRYAFTNCTDCGPRFTIIKSIPYDRVNTTMHLFPMCEQCNAEYGNPMNRRYHAQPNACGVCGPELKLLNDKGREVQGDPIEESIALLEEGLILAIKGLGGYHLAVSPEKGEWIQRLRERKGRPAKPFALMARDLETVRRHCTVSQLEEKLLLSPVRPIVLLQGREEVKTLPAEIAPDTDRYGIMLPYTPLHNLLMREGSPLLIMTSANFSEEPLVYRDDDAESELSHIADAFLIHNRDIHRPCDDSVVFVVGELVVPIRRSRGYVPRMVRAAHSIRQVFAAGASEKNTFCVFKDGKAFPSHHIGDLNNEKSLNAYTQGVDDFLNMFRIKPEAVSCDLHPDYESTRYAEHAAERWGVPLVRVQHHHAHISAVLGEHNLRERVIGVAFDGTGYGPDETVWGGEFLVADMMGFERVGHYATIPMPGGEKCIEETDRMGAAYLLSVYGSLDQAPNQPLTHHLGRRKLELLEKVILSGLNTPYTSSCGRLFDAVSAIVGLCYKPAYDAQGAILLEREAGRCDNLDDPYPYRIQEGVLYFDDMIRSIVADLLKGVGLKNIATRFHSTVILSGIDMCERIRQKTGINSVALGGGVFQNRIVLKHLLAGLKEGDFQVYINSMLPPNDGGIAYGQGVTALALLEGGAL
jgi:hydrogenase maturation protein HypF